MRFNLLDLFIVNTEKRQEDLNDTMIVPTRIDQNGKPCQHEFRRKTREFTIFKSLYALDFDENNYKLTTCDMFDLIDLIEILRSFTQNKLDTKKEYEIPNFFRAKVYTSNGEVRLGLDFKACPSAMYLDKFLCNSFATKFSKILQRCEAWQEQEA